MKLIPDNVQAIVSARVDSRPELERTLLQTAAVIGREFGATVLEHVAGLRGRCRDGRPASPVGGRAGLRDRWADEPAASPSAIPWCRRWSTAR